VSPQEGGSGAASLALLTALLLTPGVHSAACAIQGRQQLPDSLAQARSLYIQDELTEALPIFQAVAAKEPSNADAHAWLNRARQFRRLNGHSTRVRERARR